MTLKCLDVSKYPGAQLAMAAQIAMFMSCVVAAAGVHAYSPRIWVGCKIIAFANNSTKPPRAELAKLLPILKSLQLQSLAVSPWGDASDVKNRARQRALYKRRAEAVIQFYMHAGVDEKRMFWDGEVAKRRILIQYSGICLEGHEAICTRMTQYSYDELARSGHCGAEAAPANFSSSGRDISAVR